MNPLIGECDLKKIWPLVLALLVKEALEVWLGRTDKTKAGSTLELIATAVVALVVFVISKIRRKNNVQ